MVQHAAGCQDVSSQVLAVRVEPCPHNCTFKNPHLTQQLGGRVRGEQRPLQRHLCQHAAQGPHVHCRARCLPPRDSLGRSMLSSVRSVGYINERACSKGRHIAWQIVGPASVHDERKHDPKGACLRSAVRQRLHLEAQPAGVDACRRKAAAQVCDLHANACAACGRCSIGWKREV